MDSQTMHAYDTYWLSRAADEPEEETCCMCGVALEDGEQDLLEYHCLDCWLEWKDGSVPPGGEDE